MSTTTKPDPNPHRSHGVLSRITCRWQHIVLLWLSITAPLVYAIYFLAEPGFEASSLLLINPNSWTLYEKAEQVDYKRVEPFMQTQIGLITSDRVLAPAIASPEVVRLSTITKENDPRTFLARTHDR